MEEGQQRGVHSFGLILAKEQRGFNMAMMYGLITFALLSGSVSVIWAGVIAK